jgi:NADH:ubiquinone oxidoreductase subunit K
MIFLGLLIFIFGGLSLINNRKHLLLLLLSLEFCILGLFTLLIIVISLRICEILVFYLIVVVCEASLGLSVLVLNIFYYGLDYALANSLIVC